MSNIPIQRVYGISYSLASCIETLWVDGVFGFSLTSQENEGTDFSSEPTTIRRAKNGDTDAFRRIIEKHQSHVSKLLWRFTRDKGTHEELVQECFVQAYLSLRTYKAQAPFEHWISRIATRVGYRYWKQNKRHSHLSLMDNDWQYIPDPQKEPMNSIQAAEFVHNMLAKLSPRDRLVLTLRYLEQCSVKETAQRTGWTASLVKVQTHRAILKLKKLLKQSEIDFEV